MPHPTQLVRIFLASPGDVSDERSAARRIIAETNRTIASSQGITLQLVGWDTDTVPQLGADPQSIVNSQIADAGDYDLFIGIMWNRFGTPTPRAGSGTEEEFRHAVDAQRSTGRPHIMFYFCKSPTALERLEVIDQKRKVVQFREEVETMGLVQTYGDAIEFERLFREHLHRWLMTLDPKVPAPPSRLVTPPSAKPSHAADQHEKVDLPTKWLLLKDRFFRCESLIESGDGMVIAHLPSPPSEEEAVLRSFQGNHHWGKQPAPYAYENDGGMATVQEAERTSQGGRTVWKLILKLDRGERRNSMMDFSINGITPLQLAEMRAKLLLLDEAPRSPKGSPRDSMLDIGVAGISSALKIKNGILPELWKRFKHSPQLFPEFARLWAVFHLKVTFTVEHVFEMEIGSVQNRSVSVNFRGQRAAIYSNEEPQTIEVNGRCQLE